jgi:tetratricopeptide (TPR) repeat protein
VDKAIAYAMRAGDRAADGLAHEEAARLFDIALHSLEFKLPGPASAELCVDLHTRRARSFEALGQWRLEVRDLEAALANLERDQVERRCELSLSLARAWFLLLDVRPVEEYATTALTLAERLRRPDLAANAMAWLGRCRQAHGDLDGAIEMDRRSMARAPHTTTAAHIMGPLTLYLAGRSIDAISLAAGAADSARSSRDTTFMMYSLTHLGLNLAAVGRFTEAALAFQEARSLGRKYGAVPMLARATSMAAGLRLMFFDYEGAEALQAEACELARSVEFVPTIVSAGIDALFTFARRHEPGRAERLLAETASAATSTGGWHEWLWQLRLTQVRAELSLAREAFDDAILAAAGTISQARVRGRPKYETLGLITRARGLRALGRSGEAISDASAAVGVATTTGDPSLRLLALDALIELDGSDELAEDAYSTSARIEAALPDAMAQRAFNDSEVVQRVKRAQSI